MVNIKKRKKKNVYMNSSEFILIKAYLTTLNSRHPIAASIVNAYTFCIVWLVHFGAASFYRDIVI